jgi:hemerythrin-like metal-binding protein
MDKIEWTEELATGIPEIDKQHKVFLKICSDLVNCADDCNDSRKILENILKLEKFAVVHFATEGKIMNDTLYTDKSGHYRLHEHFLEELRAVRNRARAGETGSDFAEEIKENIADWFILHVRKNDIKMASFVIKK